MKTKRINKTLSCILCMVLIVAMALFTTACSDKKAEGTAQTSTMVVEDGSVLGEGSKVFAFTVVDKDGNETSMEIHTEQEMVGAALMELNVIAGEDGPYGLYVKEVNGITAVYEVDETYWAFYVNGEYGMTGVDQTPIEEGATYSFKVEKWSALLL